MNADNNEVLRQLHCRMVQKIAAFASENGIGYTEARKRAYIELNGVKVPFSSNPILQVKFTRKRK